MAVNRVNPFDKASRYVSKMNPVGFLRWHLPGLDPALSYTGWLDTRTLPFPGEPDRVCDTVAGLAHATDPGQRWALVVEFKAEPERGAVEQLLEYLVRMRRELRPDSSGAEQYHVAGSLILLTGPPPNGTLDMALPGTGMRLLVQVGVRSLRDEDAAVTLQGIREGRIDRCILPWVPLMRDGGESSNIELWKELALTEPDSQRRSDYGALALVFAELTPWYAVWRQALEGWNMRESQQVLEWQAEARAEGITEGQRDFLRLALEQRFQAPVPEDLRAAIDNLNNSDELARWFREALAANSLEAFRGTVFQGRNGS